MAAMATNDCTNKTSDEVLLELGKVVLVKHYLIQNLSSQHPLYDQTRKKRKEKKYNLR